MILVDYKGGAAFAPFAGLPHVAGIIDNLADDPQLTERARASIAGRGRPPPAAAEGRRAARRRSATTAQLRRERPDLPPLPHLFVVIDEFGELLTAEPDFVDLFLHHRPDRPVDRRAPAAVQPADRGRQAARPGHLPVVPDRAAHLLRVGEQPSCWTPPTPSTCPRSPASATSRSTPRLHAGSAPATSRARCRRRARPRAGTAESSRRPLLLPVYNGVAAANGPTPVDRASSSCSDRTSAPSLVDAVVDRLRAVATRARGPVWLPPLPTGSPLGARAATERRRGPRAARTPRPARRPGRAAAGAVAARPHPGRRPRRRHRRTAVGPVHAAAHARGIASPSRTRRAQVSRLRHGPDRRRAGPHRGVPARRRRGHARHRDRLRRLLEELHGDARHCARRCSREHGIDSLADAPRRSTPPDACPSCRAPTSCCSSTASARCAPDFEELEEPFGRPAAARRQLRHPRRRDDDPLERAADGPAAALRHADRARLNDPADSQIDAQARRDAARRRSPAAC